MRWNRRLLCLVVLLGLLPVLRPASSSATTSAPLAAWNAKTVPIPTNDVAYDAARGTVLAAVPSSQPSVGNELVELDATTGAIGRHVFVGSEPFRIALTDDGTTAYVGLRGVNRIARVDLVSFTLLSSFSTTADGFFGPRYVEDIEAVPGRNDLVVASLMKPGFSPRHEGVFAFLNGVPLPSRTPDHTGANRIDVASPSTIYGYNNETTEFGFRTLALGQSGITESSSGPSAITGFGVDIELAAGRVYSTSGLVIDPVSRTAVSSFSASGLLEVTPANNRVTFVSDTTASVFDTVTGAPVDSRTFPELVGTNTSLVATATGFAVANSAAVVLLGPSVVGGAVTLPPAPAPTVNRFGVTVVDLSVADLVSDAPRNLVYASVPSSAPSRANEVVALDPATGQVLKNIFVGSNPGPLAMSQDRSRLHVGLSTTGQVAQLELATFSRVGTISLGNSSFGGPEVAEDIEVMPGTVDTIAVSLRNTCCSPRHDGVAIYDGALRRPTATPGHTGANRIEFGSASTLYGTNNETTGFGFYKMAVSPSGLSQTAATGYLLPSFGTEIELHDGLIYADTGLIADPELGELVGRFDAVGPVEPVTASQRAYVLEGSTLVEFDLATKRRVAQRPLGFSGAARQMISTAPGLAAALDSGRVLLLNRAGDIGTAPPGAPTGVSAAGGNGQASVSWSAPASDGGSAVTGYTVTSSPGGRTCSTAGRLSCAVMGLANGTSYTFTVVAANAVGSGPPSAPSNAVVPAAPPPAGIAPVLTGSSPPTSATAGTRFGPYTFTATGNPAPTFTVRSGSLPAGLSLNSTSGVLSGTPTAAGTSTFTVQASNGVNPAAISSPITITVAAATVPERSGYWMLGSTGSVYGFGEAADLGAPAGIAAANIAQTPSGNGYWIVSQTGTVHAYGDATVLGSPPVLRSGEKVSSLSPTPTGSGYWLFTNRGRAIPYGTAAFFGDVGDIRLDGPVLGSVSTPSGNGYYMVASDGGIFAFGDAAFAGSMGRQRLDGPVVGLAPDPDGVGYWLVASDGGIFAFSAGFRGSMGGTRLNRPMVGMVAYGGGYLMVASDGGVFNFSTRPFRGSLGDNPPLNPIIAIAPLTR